MGTKHIGVGILLLVTSWNSVRAADPISTFLHIYGSEFKNPSDVAFLNKNSALVTQRTDGKVILFDRGSKKTVLDLPVSGGKGRGLLDIALSPNFKSDHLVDLFYTSAVRDGAQATGAKTGIYRWDAIKKRLNYVDSVDIPTPKTPSSNNKSNLGAPNPQSSSGSINTGASLDLSGNALVIDYTAGNSGAALLQSVQSLLASAKSDGVLLIRGVHEPGFTLSNQSSLSLIGTDDTTGSSSALGGANTLTINGLTLSSGILNFDLGSLNAGTIDLMPSQRIPALEHGAVNIGDLSSNSTAGTYRLIDYSGTAQLVYNGRFSLGTVTNDMTAAPAPEPSGAALLLLGAGALLHRRKRTL